MDTSRRNDMSGTVHGTSIQANTINGDVHVHSDVGEKRLVGLFEELVEVRRQLTESMRAERGITQVVWVLQAVLINLQDDIVRLTRERDEQLDQAERWRLALVDARASKRRTERQLSRAESERKRALRLVQLAQFKIRVLEAGADVTVPLSALPQTGPERLRIGLDRVDAYLDAQSEHLEQLSIALDEPRGRIRTSVDSSAPAGRDARSWSTSQTVQSGEVDVNPVRSRVLPSGWLTVTSSTQTSEVAHAVSMSDTSVRVEPVSADDADLLQSVVELGDLHRGRLGLLPYAAFTEAAEQSRLLVALAGEDRLPLGYALYRLPRNEVALTHLCVREEARNRGVAKALVDTITDVHRDRLGVRAKCRDDYGLDLAWRKLGFRPRARTVGRGTDRAPMTV
ncbi:acetyltransferase (GNAT) family protein [Saccharothrix carnea]|uniref:Acetyltransferase (GNAT) family protein n=1 Tax=Saccharothrix carnea TaxID=1280637 RepID=A0A2P8I496_SACCR|nr:GNAT family N-acetyltransferase [Saccharothrix carnea]PSL53292.1 acetyltransferase (GNAT) family protein [Saccharothrix carnea]